MTPPPIPDTLPTALATTIIRKYITPIPLTLIRAPLTSSLLVTSILHNYQLFCTSKELHGTTIL